MDHIRNCGSLDSKKVNIGTGLVGSRTNEIVMRIQIKINKYGKIIDSKFKTFGCASSISCSSYATQYIRGKYINDNLNISHIITKKLNLPPSKLYCSILADNAIKMAIDDIKKKYKIILI